MAIYTHKYLQVSSNLAYRGAPPMGLPTSSVPPKFTLLEVVPPSLPPPPNPFKEMNEEESIDEYECWYCSL